MSTLKVSLLSLSLFALTAAAFAAPAAPTAPPPAARPTVYRSYSYQPAGNYRMRYYQPKRHAYENATSRALGHND